jgi:hypothetical protein
MVSSGSCGDGKMKTIGQARESLKDTMWGWLIALIIFLFSVCFAYALTKDSSLCLESCMKQGYDTSRSQNNLCECSSWERNELDDWRE